MMNEDRTEPSKALGDVVFAGWYKNWTAYAQSDGIIVLYRTRRSAKGDALSMERVVTNATDMDGVDAFMKELRRKKKGKKRPEYNPYKDDNQMRIE